MIRIWFFIALVVTAAPVQSGPIENSIVAAMRLSEEPGYTWKTSVEDDARSYLVEGKTQRDGYTRVTLPLIDSIADRLGRDAEPQIEAVFKGDDRLVLRVGESWRTPAELPKAEKREADYYVITPRASSAFQSAAGDLEDPLLPPTIVVTPTGRDDSGSKPFCNARLAVNRPHEELAIIVSSGTALQVDGENVTGDLTDIGARLLLAPGNDDSMGTPLLAAGKFKLRIKDHRVTRYQLRLEGVMQVGKKRILVHQNSSTDISHVGETQFEVPEEARLKLGD